MNDSDEKLNAQTNSLENVKADGNRAAFAAPSEKESDGRGKTDIGDVAGTAIKTVAVALSLVILITSILCVALPLSAMRVFNNLGMYERALVSGTRYIDGEIARNADKDFDANDLGRYRDFGSSTEQTEEAMRKSTLPEALNNAEFIEALEVCINLSDKLMREYSEAGKTADAKYFAEYLERYTLYYSSLYGASGTFAEKDRQNKTALLPAYHPFVYSVRHTLMTQNFRARYYLDEFGEMLYYGGYNGDVITSIDSNINTYNGTNIYDGDGNLSITIMNGFIDYVDQISEYVAVEFERCGMNDAKLNELPETREKYKDALTGEEFKLFITKANGYTQLYNGLKSFPRYAQAAVSYRPQNLDEQLMQLFWVQKLATAAIRLGNMEYLIWFNREHYGNSMQAINDEYGREDGDNFRHYNTKIVYTGADGLDGVYNLLMKNYIDNYTQRQ